MLVRPLVISSRAELEDELKRIHVDPERMDAFLERNDPFILKISGLGTPAVGILRESALGLGADVAVPKEIGSCSDVIFLGSRHQLHALVKLISAQSFEVGELGKEIEKLFHRLDNQPLVLDLPQGKIFLDHPIIMGVLNVTPDSFYDGGRFLDPVVAESHIDEMLKEGADIIDVGAESTRPGADPVTTSQELERLGPIFAYLEALHTVWSVDTHNPEVARDALERGASIINDVSGGSDPSLWALARDYKACYVLMHIKGSPKTMQDNPHYDDFNAELYCFFNDRLTQMEERGLARNRVIIDPGIGFGKRVEDNTAAIRRLGELKAFALPILVGASRKSFIGKILGLPAEERLEASIAAAVLAFSNGAHILRVHDVKQTRRALDASAAIQQSL